MTRAFRDGWERIFAKPAPALIRNPFALRPDLSIRYEVPSDFSKRDLARLVRHLGTLCIDWESHEGLAEVRFVAHTDEARLRAWLGQDEDLHARIAELQARVRELEALAQKRGDQAAQALQERDALAARFGQNP